MAAESYADYCKGRANQERALGKAAGRGSTRLVHIGNADRYDSLAKTFAIESVS